MIKNLHVMLETWVQSMSGKSPGGGDGWLPTPVFLPGESHGQRSLVGYSPRGRKELDTTEQLNTVQAVIEDGLPWWLSGKDSTC